jgi:uncharacterized RDD family membrane protein YckC
MINQCEQCGTLATPMARFCTNCGAAIPASVTPGTWTSGAEAAAPPPPGGWYGSGTTGTDWAFSHSPTPSPPPPPTGYDQAWSRGWNTPDANSPRVDPLGRRYADWGTRAVAALIDFGVNLGVWIVLILIAVAGSHIRTAPDHYGNTSTAGGGVAIIALALLTGVVVTLGYHLLNGGQRGQTIGKRIVGIQTRDAETGGPISYPRAFGRYVAYVVAWLILPIVGIIDLIWPLWDDRRQTVHDKAVHSVVVCVNRKGA